MQAGGVHLLTGACGQPGLDGWDVTAGQTHLRVLHSDYILLKPLNLLLSPSTDSVKQSRRCDCFLLVTDLQLHLFIMLLERNEPTGQTLQNTFIQEDNGFSADGLFFLTVVENIN